MPDNEVFACAVCVFLERRDFDGLDEEVGSCDFRGPDDEVEA